jgi:hypothetical protein
MLRLIFGVLVAATAVVVGPADRHPAPAFAQEVPPPPKPTPTPPHEGERKPPVVS